MQILEAQTITKITRGQLLYGNPETRVSGCCIDSRGAKPGDLFFPLQGEKANGHAYIRDAVENGAAGYLLSDDNYLVKGAFAVKVTDVLESLQQLAAHRRSFVNAKVVAITGSTGKTTTRDFLVSILSKRFKVSSSKKNFNTEIGVPLTILNSPDDTEIMILEMGMRGSGQIRLLTSIAKPDIGVILNISNTHISLLGSEENIARAKGELLESLQKEGQAVLNAGDSWTPYLAKLCPCTVRTFGKNGDFKAVDITLDDLGRASFELRARAEKIRVSLPIPGRHNVDNALAAAAVAQQFSVSLQEIAPGLENASVCEWRMEINKGDGFTLLADYYNASPQSMKAALETLASIKAGKRKVAILGDMLELGEAAQKEHEKIVNQALGFCDLVFFVGKHMTKAASGLTVKTYPTAQALVGNVKKHIKLGDVILLKASRVMAFETLAREILEE